MRGMSGRGCVANMPQNKTIWQLDESANTLNCRWIAYNSLMRHGSVDEVGSEAFLTNAILGYSSWSHAQA